jgi:hypothetical protein
MLKIILMAKTEQTKTLFSPCSTVYIFTEKLFEVAK